MDAVRRIAEAVARIWNAIRSAEEDTGITDYRRRFERLFKSFEPILKRISWIIKTELDMLDRYQKNLMVLDFEGFRLTP